MICGIKLIFISFLKKEEEDKEKEKEEKTIRVKRSGFVKCKYGRQICIKRNI